MRRAMVTTVLLLAVGAQWAQADGAPAPVTFDQFVSVWYRLWEATKAAGIDTAGITLKTYVDRQPFDQRREHELKLKTSNVQWRVFRVMAPATWGKTLVAWQTVLGNPRILMNNSSPGSDEAVWYFPPPLHLGISLLGDMRGDEEGNAIVRRLREGQPAFAPQGEAGAGEDAQLPDPTQ